MQIARVFFELNIDLSSQNMMEKSQAHINEVDNIMFERNLKQNKLHIQ